jgi:hypothetical protein
MNTTAKSSNTTHYFLVIGMNIFNMSRLLTYKRLDSCDMAAMTAEMVCESELIRNHFL